MSPDMNTPGTGGNPPRPRPPRTPSPQDGQPKETGAPEQPARPDAPSTRSAGSGNGSQPTRRPAPRRPDGANRPPERPPGGAKGAAGKPDDARSGKPNPSASAPKPSDGKDGKRNGQNNAGAPDKPGNPAAKSADASSPGTPADGLNDQAKDHAKGKLDPKNLGANATGVDYSDKGMKDRLEHQAADVAMDATPGLGQFNQARKQIKNANKMQRQAGVDNKATEKVEEVMDKGVDTGIKMAKVTAGATAGGAVGGAAMMTIMMMKMLMALKNFAIGAVTKTLGFFANAFNAVSGFFSNLLGIGATAAKAVAGAAVTVATATAGFVGVGVVNVVTPKDVGSSCVPKAKVVDSASQEYVAEPGEARVAQETNAKKLWSVYSRIGGTKEQTAAVLGNLHHESAGLDPTATETVYDEPFQMGKKKKHAMDVDYDVMQIDSAYGSKYPAIKRIGIGLAQWTNGRNQLLIDFSKKTDSNWFDFDTQVRFMLAGDDATRQTQLKNFLSGGNGNVSVETEKFMNTWIGLSSPNASLGDRQAASTDYMFILERAEADNSYADSILSGLNVDRSQGNTAQDAFAKDDGCGNAIATHYANAAEDGTGEVPAGIELVPWTRETLPEGLRKYMKDPQNAGLSWGSGGGWAPGVIPNQCVAFASSYFMLVYPDWNKGGRGTSRPTGNGIGTASGWASHYGESTSKSPSGGAVFSLPAPSPTGHTGFVQHVFANGDIFVAEQNIPGVSGELAGMSYSWGFRVIPKDVYQSQGFTFFKPSGATPNWGTTGKA